MVFCLTTSVLLSLWSSGLSFPGHNTPPVFDMKREWLIPEDELVGRRVTTVRTRDDENDPIEYGIEPAVFLDGSSYFTVDKKSGEVFLASPLSGMAGNDFYLYITANDGHQMAKIEVYVRIVKANAAQPDAVVDRVIPHLSFPTAFLPDQIGWTEHHSTPTEPPLNLTTVKHKTEEDHVKSVVTTVFPLVATVAFAPVIGVVSWLLLRRCKVKERLKVVEKKLSERGKLPEERDVSLQRADSNVCEESTGVVGRKWEFSRHHLRFLCLLGEGCFGQVWKCEVQSDPLTLVAVKTLKENASEKEKKDLVNELEVMKLLDPHPNVVTLLGCCTDRDPMFLIMEYVERGKLQTYLRESRAERFYGNMHGSSCNLTSRDLTSFAYQVARGMEYLSSRGIIHRDLAARNILVTDAKTCKVADFGFARDVIINHIYERKSEGRLPLRWMAPESLYDNIYTTKTDVWSFGVLMWEIVTLGSTPYPGMAASDVLRKIKEGFRLEKPDHCKREVYNVMFYCWDMDPVKRPAFTELVQLLDKLLVSENDYIELDRFPDHSYYNITSLSGEKL